MHVQSALSLGTGLLCSNFHLLCYAALLEFSRIMLTLLHCAQHYAHLQCKKLLNINSCIQWYDIFISPLLCYVAVFKKFTYYAQNYA